MLDDVIEPMRAAGLGKHVKNLYNDYIYFWRYATWRAIGRPMGPGIVAFITASSYLDGVSIGGLRSHLRDAFDELHVIDLGGEGRGARTEENVFDILTPVAIAVGVRTTGDSDCLVRYTRVPGTRVEKLDWLDGHGIHPDTAVPVPGKQLEVLTPRGSAEYHTWPEVTQVFPWIHSGSQYKRTWPIAASKGVLQRRWDRLLELTGDAREAAFKLTRDRSLRSAPEPLVGTRGGALGALKAGARPAPFRYYGYRSFDRQWCLADSRLADFGRPDLWRTLSDQQIFFTTLTSTKLGRGPVLTATPYVPDLDHFSGRGAKNVMPLWRNSKASQANMPAGLLPVLAAELGGAVTAEDVAAYVHAIGGTPAYAERFADELGEQAGPFRVPITKDRALFESVVAFGRELLWWHTWGERFGDPAEMDGTARELAGVTGMPETFSYDATAQQLIVGTGRFGPVELEVWEFQVSGLKPLQSWLGYRMAKGKGKKSSPLDDIRPTKWTFTDELLGLLAILEHTVAVTPNAATLLEKVLAGPVFTAAELPMPTEAERKAPR